MDKHDYPLASQPLPNDSIIVVAMGEARAQTTSHIHMAVFISINISFSISARHSFYLVFFLVSSASAGLVSWRGQRVACGFAYRACDFN